MKLLFWIDLKWILCFCYFHQLWHKCKFFNHKMNSLCFFRYIKNKYCFISWLIFNDYFGILRQLNLYYQFNTWECHLTKIRNKRVPKIPIVHLHHRICSNSLMRRTCLKIPKETVPKNPIVDLHHITYTNLITRRTRLSVCSLT